MKKTEFIKLICSLPVILIVLYFSKFLGIILLLARCFLYRRENLSKSAKVLFGIGAFLLVCTLGVKLIEDLDIPIISKLLELDIIDGLYGYSIWLIGFGIIVTLISYFGTSLFNGVKSGITDQIKKQEQMKREVAQENDMKIK